MFNVSRTTIRTAINELQNEGYLVKQQGRGTFVANNSYAECVALLQGFYEDATQRGNTVSTMLISAELVIPEQTVQEMLSVGREEVLKIQRVRYSDGVPTQLGTSYLPRASYEKLNWQEIDFPPPRFTMSWRRPGWRLITARKYGRCALPVRTKQPCCRPR